MVSERVKEVTAEVLGSYVICQFFFTPFKLRFLLIRVPLKSLLDSSDFNKLLLEIRRRVEYEATGAVHR